jgi:hypothetical protein
VIPFAVAWATSRLSLATPTVMHLTKKRGKPRLEVSAKTPKQPARPNAGGSNGCEERPGFDA